jgi:3-oxoacyl-[acyl-carrier-protein] synthase-3
VPIKSKKLRAYVACVSSYLPEEKLTNDKLAAEFPEWSVDKIYEKTGIRNRHIAAEHETCSSMTISTTYFCVLKVQITYCLRRRV